MDTVTVRATSRSKAKVSIGSVSFGVAGFCCTRPRLSLHARHALGGPACVSREMVRSQRPSKPRADQLGPPASPSSARRQEEVDAAAVRGEVYERTTKDIGGVITARIQADSPS